MSIPPDDKLGDLALPCFKFAKTLARFPEAVEAALSSSEPMMITRYILDAATAFNRFYHECQILSCEDEKIRERRVAMTNAVHTVLGSAFGSSV